MLADELKTLLQDEIASLQRFALKLTRNFADAEDLAQDTLARALLKAHLFDGAYLRGWLFTMCRRIFLNDLRKVKNRGAHCSIDIVSEAATGVPSNQEEQLELQQVMGFLRQLPQQDQEIFDLVLFKGARYDETALLLNVPIGTIRSRFSRARSRLRVLVDSDSQAHRHTGGSLSAAG